PFYYSGKEDERRDFNLPAPEPPKPLRGRLSLAAKDWGVVLELPGFAVRSVDTRPDGTRYLIAENESTSVVVSLTLKVIMSGDHVSSCRELLEEKTKIKQVKIRDVRFSRSGDFDILRYAVPEFRGQPLNQESLYACQAYDNTLIDLHISKSNY